MKCFKDLEGKIPAKEGDRVALVKMPYIDDLIQRKPGRRPILHNLLPTFTKVAPKRHVPINDEKK